MKLRSPVIFSSIFVVFAALFTAYFDISIRTNADAAESRFHQLVALNAPRRAAVHGERAIALSLKAGASEAEMAPLKADLADAQFIRGDYSRTSDLLLDALISSWGQDLGADKRLMLEDRLARAYLADGNVEKAAAIFKSFLDLAGDAATRSHGQHFHPAEQMYADKLTDAADAFMLSLNHTDPREVLGETPEHILTTASHLADLGGFYGMHEDGEYVAAGLLASAYEARKRVLGGDHQDTVQLTLILGPLYQRMGRLRDAEALYLDAFHAQERVKGANSPDLSLYIKLLAGNYEKQERFTEAQALYEHLRGLFRDAFGAQRYSVNQEFDRREYINRPVSQQFPLENDYKPEDLVSAAQFFVPTAKGPNLDEMKLRLAPDPGVDAREANLPARLAQLISLCRSESNENVSLRSGYRSFETQRILHKHNGEKGTVTRAGISEHQTGLAADINVNGRFMRQSDRAYQCFEENAFRFGFILSYPPGNDYLPGAETFEPWHWRYVGIQTAQLYREAGPYNKPQEFLAALPCYQERAASGVFPAAGEPDICLIQLAPTVTAQTASEKTLQTDTDLSDMTNGETARILNDGLKAAAKR